VNVSFHRCREPEDFDRLQEILQPQDKNGGAAPVSWWTVEDRAARWWQTKLVAMSQQGRGNDAAEMVKRIFFDDDGFA
jgi:hypothetical protein